MTPAIFEATHGREPAMNHTTKLWVRARRGETRELYVFCEARIIEAGRAQAETLRWARDAQGRWYSFSTMDERSLVESSSGDWFSILA
jgi:hypothetical protein